MDVETSLVTRGRLAELGFRRLPDMWLYCSSEGRCRYFERWYHSRWNYTAVIGRRESDPLLMNEQDFLAGLQAHLLDDDDEAVLDPWEEIYCGS